MGDVISERVGPPQSEGSRTEMSSAVWDWLKFRRSSARRIVWALEVLGDSSSPGVVARLKFSGMDRFRRGIALGSNDIMKFRFFYYGTNMR